VLCARPGLYPPHPLHSHPTRGEADLLGKGSGARMRAPAHVGVEHLLPPVADLMYPRLVTTVGIRIWFRPWAGPVAIVVQGRCHDAHGSAVGRDSGQGRGRA